MPSSINEVAPEIKTPDDLLSVKEAAALLRMSPGWLYGSGIPYVRCGRSRRYRRNDLLSYIESHLRQPRMGVRRG